MFSDVGDYIDGQTIYSALGLGGIVWLLNWINVFRRCYEKDGRIVSFPTLTIVSANRSHYRRV